MHFKVEEWAFVASNLEGAEVAGQRPGVDNISALWALVKGPAEYRFNDMACITHLILSGKKSHMYFEYIKLKLNWVDGLSRAGFVSIFVTKHAFPLRAASVCARWWQVPLVVRTGLTS